MTSSYVDLVADPNLFVGFRHPDAGPRNKRLAYIGAMIGGALMGAGLHRYAGSWVVVVVTVTLKGVVLAIFGMAKGEVGGEVEGCVLAR